MEVELDNTYDMLTMMMTMMPNQGDFYQRKERLNAEVLSDFSHLLKIKYVIKAAKHMPKNSHFMVNTVY